MYLRFEKAFDVMYDCLENYNAIQEVDKVEKRLYGQTEPPTSRRNMSTMKFKTNFRKFTIKNLYEVIIDSKTPNEMVINIKRKIHHSDHKEPFAKYCAAVYYTYMVTDNSSLNMLLKLIEYYINETNDIKLKNKILIHLTE
ncbi:uncharacterized protein LOC126898341 [Daktulosphaira vitifoliae]|uniref:uncharacterized protein LOC126898341 n=1 Tax=Daktulosphaira vitifoliae TaxID=58002 RepID=UPI0021AAE209|nr:uncharacterized protein LOC126898341 [Daktulosphaira vitifoliae]